PRGLPAPGGHRTGSELEQPRALLRRGGRGHAPHPRRARPPQAEPEGRRGPPAAGAGRDRGHRRRAGRRSAGPERGPGKAPTPPPPAGPSGPTAPPPRGAGQKSPPGPRGRPPHPPTTTGRTPAAGSAWKWTGSGTAPRPERARQPPAGRGFPDRFSHYL